jgi:CheY-like chemotaxis protein
MSKVLIIEDDPPYQKIYKKKFEVAGYMVEVAVDGEDGVAKMASFRPDIVLVDLMMPKMDGFQFLDTVKADPTLAATPVLVLTNLSTPEDSERALQKGALGVIVKSNTEPNAIVRRANSVLKSTKES